MPGWAERLAISHSELRKKVPRYSGPDRTHGDENETKAYGLPRAVPKKTEQRIQQKNESSQRSEQYQGEEVIRVPILDQNPINQGSANQGAANQTTSE